MITFTVPFKSGVNLDGLLQMSIPDTDNVKKGQEISTQGKYRIDKRIPLAKYNDTNNIKKNVQNYILTKGKISVLYNWINEDNITENDLNVYEEYLNNEPESWDFTRDFENKTFKQTYAYNGENSSWGDIPCSYLLDTTNISLVVEEDNTSLVCITKYTSDDNWSARQIDIQPNKTFDVERPKSDLCYIIFTQDVEVNGNPLSQWSYKKLLKNNITVKNRGSIPCKVIQYYK